MPYFKINYNKLENLEQINYSKFIISICILIIFLLILSCFINTFKTISTYGLYKDSILHVKITSELSDAVLNNEYIIFNNQKTGCIKVLLGDYEINDNGIYQDVFITVADEFNDNEIGLVKFYYHKQKIIEYIFELFK